MILAIEGRSIKIDDADWPLVAGYCWRVKSRRRSKQQFYAFAGGGRVLMHRLIAAAQPGEEVDHVNGDTLDNRRQNLRRCTRAQNARNAAKRAPERASSQFKGVSFCRRKGKWRATITLDGKTRSLGYHETEVAAALAYDAGSYELHGAFGRPNFSTKHGMMGSDRG